jgi:hypothetical protein
MQQQKRWAIAANPGRDLAAFNHEPTGLERFEQGLPPARRLATE